MRHSQLKAFHHVALLGGFSRAAEALSLTQPAVSEQVRKLEQDHDVLLFHREKKRVLLTGAGEKLLQLTKHYFEVEGQIADHLSESGAAAGGELRIIADSAQHLTGFLGPFQQRYPNVTISLRAGNTGAILDELRSYNAEIGVVGSLTPGKDMSVLNLGATEITAFAARGLLPASQQTLTFRELAHLPLVFREDGSKTREKVEAAARAQGITLKPAIVAEGREAVRELAASGAGVGFVSMAEFGHDSRLVQYRLQGAGLEMSESMVYLTQRRDVKVIRAFMEFATSLQAQKTAAAQPGV
ncbi:LysR substrate-binding domain-containing protein [Leisingera aquaemixtae]|uniref:LysR substrate-binding domain-containing protein n=1 Tax=Leisingera aquaemixtae TaxID=1396826 RepID=UPI0021A5196B|nr:LysR substrate-binding domain-containing protein [Leisingera aquaemixtae]UWQ45157.1 LysR family transcriptional regulator [Leisingera aquaemixtae]